jgi:hypothetical protein
VPFRQRRILVHAVLILAAAFVLGPGLLLPDGSEPDRPRRGGRAAAPKKSGEDAGFSIALTQPTDPFLVGRHTIGVEAIVPPGDRILQVDFFVDGRLVDTDRQAPYSSTHDFGPEIKRHTIVVSALTSGGRRAKVSLVSRAAQLDGDPARPITVVPAIVRDPAGRLVEGLSVSDFTLLENGQRQTILHFDREPAPLSIGIVLHAPDPVAAARGPLLRQAAVLADDLPPYHALAFLDAPRAPQPAPGRAAPGGTAQASLIASPSPARRATGPALPALDFTYDRNLFVQRLAESAGVRAVPPSRQPSLPEALSASAAALSVRPRGRILIALVAGPPAAGACPVLAAETPAAGGREDCDGGAGRDCEQDSEQEKVAGGTDPGGEGRAPDGGGAVVAEDPAGPPDEALEASLEELKKAGVTLHVLALGDARGDPFATLRQASEDTGGEFFAARSQSGLEAFARLLTETLMRQYLIAYRSPRPERPGWRSLEVRVREPDLQVRVRKALFIESPATAFPAAAAPARAAAPVPAATPPRPDTSRSAPARPASTEEDADDPAPPGPVPDRAPPDDDPGDAAPPAGDPADPSTSNGDPVNPATSDGGPRDAAPSAGAGPESGP